MNFKCVSNLNSLLLFFLVFAKPLFSQECDSNGIRCISCTDYQTCNAGVPQGVVISCKSGEGCADDQLKQCQKKLSCFALTECTQNGIFSDPMDDTRFFVCLGDASSGFLKYEFRCPDENFFDVTTQACIPKAATPTKITTPNPDNSESITPYPDDNESTTTQFTPDSTSPTTESTLGSTSTAPPVPEPTITTTAPPVPEPTTTTTAPPVPKPTITTTALPPFVCSQPGTFPNPGSSYFNENTLKCSLKITPACQEQISKNSTSTLLPVTSIPPITTATSASKPSTTTVSTTISTTTTVSVPKPTTTTTTTPSSSTPVSCLTGGSFPHPTDCKIYYRCSVSGKAFLYTCPGKTYFNEFTKRCSLTITPRCKALVQG